MYAHTKNIFTRFEGGEGAVTEVVASRTQRSADILKIGIVAAKDSFEYPRAGKIYTQPEYSALQIFGGPIFKKCFFEI